MRRTITFNCIILSILCQVFFPTSVQATNVQDFYFESFEADYYLKPDLKTGSKLQVIESLTAIFPDYPQNKGICRAIPFTNQNGNNITIKHFDPNHIIVTRNNQPEPIYSFEKHNSYFEICTGTNDYLTGRQVFTFTYEFTKVITEFSNTNTTWQELYWDTNGTAWRQPFHTLTARVHFSDPTVWTQKSWCYVGSHGKSDSKRCHAEPLPDGVAFSTNNLSSGENLTFDLELHPQSFLIPAPDKNYNLFFITTAIISISVLSFIYFYRRFQKTADKRHFYQNYFIKPEYQPLADFTLLESSEIYVGKKKDPKVALLLQLIVTRKIILQKIKNPPLGHYWAITVKNLSQVDLASMTLLTILNNGNPVNVGDTIKLKRHIASSTLIALGKKFQHLSLTFIIKKGLADTNYQPTNPVNYLTLLFLTLPFLGILLMFFNLWFGEISFTSSDVINAHGEVIVGFIPLVFVIIIDIILTILIIIFLRSRTLPFLHRTLKGLEVSRYMDGLKLYIKMAEKDRLDFLHSVKGADTSPTGIVNLYEKLLPYSAIFGLETSWLQELSKYYQLKETTAPDWYNAGNFIAISELSRILRTASAFATSSTTYSSSGFSSSDSSGGGGGGFSGGGGGGGGGGGR